jgi:hypothetical protein
VGDVMIGALIFAALALALTFVLVAAFDRWMG